VEWAGVFIARISDGKFVEIWQYSDALGLMDQLRTELPKE
jgi:hypothetical protein